MPRELGVLDCLRVSFDEQLCRLDWVLLRVLVALLRCGKELLRCVWIRFEVFVARFDHRGVLNREAVVGEFEEAHRLAEQLRLNPLPGGDGDREVGCVVVDGLVGGRVERDGFENPRAAVGLDHVLKLRPLIRSAKAGVGLAVKVLW